MKINSLEFRALRYILFTVLFFCIITGCSTQSFEGPDKNDDVFRVKIENTDDRELRYIPAISLYYIDRKENLDLSDSTIAPGDAAHVIVETEEGAFGVSADVRLRPPGTTGRLTLEKGTGTGDDFVVEEVVKTSSGNGILFFRFGQVY